MTRRGTAEESSSENSSCMRARICSATWPRDMATKPVVDGVHPNSVGFRSVQSAMSRPIASIYALSPRGLWLLDGDTEGIRT